MFQIKLKALNKRSLNLYYLFLISIFKKLDKKISRINLPTIKKRITLLKSPHVYKSTREQFQFTLYKRLIVINKLDTNLLKLLFLNKPKILKISIKKLKGE